MQTVEKFYLASTEGPRPKQPWECHPLGRLSWYDRDDLMHISITPHIPGNVYRASGVRGRIRELVIASRFEGHTLFPIIEFPLPVYIAVILNDTFRATGRARDNDLALADWGVMAASLEEARLEMYRS